MTAGLAGKDFAGRDLWLDFQALGGDAEERLSRLCYWVLQLDARQREEAVARAMMTINAPYRYGGSSLETGFDCSGLVQYVFRGVSGHALPRSTIQWARASQPIDAGRLQRGDLVFFNTLGAAFSHMGIYIGDRQFVHAPSSGKGVRIDSLDQTYYITRFNGARTVFAG